MAGATACKVKLILVAESNQQKCEFEMKKGTDSSSLYKSQDLMFLNFIHHIYCIRTHIYDFEHNVNIFCPVRKSKTIEKRNLQKKK